MKTLTFSIEILAKPEKIWDLLWDNESYTKWTKPFLEGCYYVTESFEEGYEIKFLAPSGDGMLSKIFSLRSGEFVSFEHIGMITNGENKAFQSEDDSHQYLETYELIQHENSTRLIVKVDTLEPWVETMNAAFPEALKIVKELAEF